MIKPEDNTHTNEVAISKTYHTPKLTLLGPIHSLVLTGGGTGGDGGGALDSLS